MGERVVVIGASMDGIQAIGDILAALPADFAAPILVVQHTRPPSQLAEILGRRTRLPVVTARDGALIEPGRVYVSVPDRHLLIRAGEVILGDGPTENRFRPSIDALFRSAALTYGRRVAGVVLTGYLYDGAAGLLAIKDCGGVAIVQDPAEARVPDMPLAALRTTAVDHVCRLAEIAPKLIELVADTPEGNCVGALTVELENRLAADANARDTLAELLANGTKTPLVCPSCAAWLYELPDPRVRRYRCERGHAVSEAALALGTRPALGHVA